MATDKSSTAAPLRPQRRPLRITSASIGLGLAWAALHVPHALSAGLVVRIDWTMEALTAIFVAFSVLEIGTSLIGLLARAVSRGVAHEQRRA